MTERLRRTLGRRARQAIESGAASVWVSAVTAWEIAIKWRVGSLKLPNAPHAWLPKAIADGPFEILSISIEHAVGVASLPDHHGDPFDRLLIVQAQLETMTIVTANAAFEDYDVALLDARS